jgi:hypothetical protein
MLAYILAIAVGLASFLLFLAAFFRPKLHRQDDFLWSGIGLFYALVLWLCAQQLRGGLLLGQVAGTFLVLAFGWQTLKLRWAIAHPESIAEVENFSLLAWSKNRLGSLLRKKQPVIPVSPPETVDPPTPQPSTEEISTTEVGSPPLTSDPETETVIEETITTTPIDENTEEVTKKTTVSRLTKPANPQKQGFSLKGMFAGKQKPVSKPDLATALNEDDTENTSTDEETLEPQQTNTPPVETETARAYIVEQDKEIVIEVNRVKVEDATEGTVEQVTEKIQETIVTPKTDQAKTEASPSTAPEASIESEGSEDKPENV